MCRHRHIVKLATYLEPAKEGTKTAKIITHFIKQVKRYSAMLGAVPFSPDQAEKYVTPQITQSDFGCAGSDRHGLSSYKIQCRAWNGEGVNFVASTFHCDLRRAGEWRAGPSERSRAS